MRILELTKDDYQLYKEMRLELLKNEPNSFGSSFEEENLFEDKIWKYSLTKDNVSTFGAFHKNEMVGLCVVVYNPRSKMSHLSTLHSMYVRKEHRGKGVGRKLIEFAEKTSRKRGVHRMNLSVVSSNVNAIALYKKIGFKEYGLEPDTIKVDNKFYSLTLMTKSLKEE